MTPFQCIPIPTEVAERFRRTGTDDRGNVLRHVEASAATGFPCRHCLHFASVGEEMLLGSYDLPRPRGVYWTPSPIFLHARQCAPFGSHNTIAPIIAEGTLVSVRAYDEADQCLYDLGVVCAGTEVDAPLEHALADPRTSFVNIHTARPGCLLSRVDRLA